MLSSNEKTTMFIMHIAILLLVGAALMPVTLAKPTSDEDGFSSKENQPNILFIFADDLGYSDIGYNNGNVRTPVLDKLAKNGRILTKNYAQNMCVPSRQALMTGRYPWKDRRSFFQMGSPTCVPTDIPFLPELLKNVGYKTHMIGKWHLGFCQKACLPTSRGFDSFYGMYMGMSNFINHTDCESHFMYDWHRDSQPDKTVIGEHATEVITVEAIKILENHNPDDGPFFMYVAHPAPHVPLQVQQKYIDLYDHEPEVRRRYYLGMVSQMDEEIGRIIDRLDDLRLRDNTLIIFTSDNGGEGVIGPSDNSPLRGSKLSLYEGGSLTVGFVNGDMVTGKGDKNDGFFSTIDWLPTLLKLAKADVDGLKLDGIDQSNMILHGTKSKRTEFVYMVDLGPFPILGSAAYRDEEFKIIWGYEGVTDGRGRVPFVTGDPDREKLQYHDDTVDPVLDIVSPYRFFFTPDIRQLWAMEIGASKFDLNDIDSGRVHLFNLKDDPEEYHDLAQLPEYQERVLSMKQRIVKLVEEYRPPQAVGDRTPQAYDAMIDGTWSTGFCEDLDLRG